MYGLGSLFGLIVLAIPVGSICGMLALSRARRVSRDLETLKNQLRSLEDQLRKGEAPVPATQKEIVEEEPQAPTAVTDSWDLQPPQETQPIPETSPPPEQDRITSSPPPLPPASPSLSLEMKVGTKWLNWVGIVMLLVGLGFFLKYAYDNAWIGPTGRVAIGTIFGLVALGLGERFRRREWSILFQVLTGGGLAIFYLCIYFSFEVYRLADQTISFLLAILVTGLAVVMAVSHNAPSIATVALIGGFLCPVLLSTGINRPYAFFTWQSGLAAYILVEIEKCLQCKLGC